MRRRRRAQARHREALVQSHTRSTRLQSTKKGRRLVIVNEEVLDVTKFLPDHGGEKAILLYAGRDATEEFNMLHDPQGHSPVCSRCGDRAGVEVGGTRPPVRIILAAGGV